MDHIARSHLENPVLGVNEQVALRAQANCVTLNLAISHHHPNPSPDGHQPFREFGDQHCSTFTLTKLIDPPGQL